MMSTIPPFIQQSAVARREVNDILTESGSIADVWMNPCGECCDMSFTSVIQMAGSQDIMNLVMSGEIDEEEIEKMMTNPPSMDSMIEKVVADPRKQVLLKDYVENVNGDFLKVYFGSDIFILNKLMTHSMMTYDDMLPDESMKDDAQGMFTRQSLDSMISYYFVVRCVRNYLNAVADPVMIPFFASVGIEKDTFYQYFLKSDDARQKELLELLKEYTSFGTIKLYFDIMKLILNQVEMIVGKYNRELKEQQAYMEKIPVVDRNWTNSKYTTVDSFINSSKGALKTLAFQDSGIVSKDFAEVCKSIDFSDVTIKPSDKILPYLNNMICGFELYFNSAQIILDICSL